MTLSKQINNKVSTVAQRPSKIWENENMLVARIGLSDSEPSCSHYCFLFTNLMFSQNDLRVHLTTFHPFCVLDNMSSNKYSHSCRFRWSYYCVAYGYRICMADAEKKRKTIRKMCCSQVKQLCKDKVLIIE